jgi:hypothetical protein
MAVRLQASQGSYWIDVVGPVWRLQTALAQIKAALNGLSGRSGHAWRVELIGNQCQGCEDVPLA